MSDYLVNITCFKVMKGSQSTRLTVPDTEVQPGETAVMVIKADFSGNKKGSLIHEIQMINSKLQMVRGGVFTVDIHYNMK